MHAMDFYVSTCRCVMQADPADPESWAELYRLLPCLRQSLSCYVCFQLVLDPMGPDHNVCKHSVCENCMGGKMRLKPSCSWCKDHWEFVPNTLLRVLVSCFKKLCVYIYNCPIGRSICNANVNGETNNLVTILKEVIDFDDHYSSDTIQTTELHSLHVNEMDSEVPDTQTTSSNAIVDAKPGCSSDEDVPKLPDVSADEEEQEAEEEEEEETFEDPETDDQESEQELPVRRNLRRTTSQSSELSNSDLTEKKKSAQNKKRVNQKLQKKSSTRSAVFLKRTTQNRRKSFLRKKVGGQQTKKQTVSKFYPVRRRTNRDAPHKLDKIDNSEPVTKKMKKELQPPELKPPSFCKCGKSGNYNQLTCLGQRCPCYSMKLPCIGCKCKGCRNPKKGPNIKTNSVRCMSDLWSSCSRTSAAVS